MQSARKKLVFWWFLSFEAMAACGQMWERSLQLAQKLQRSVGGGGLRQIVVVFIVFLSAGVIRKNNIGKNNENIYHLFLERFRRSV